MNPLPSLLLPGKRFKRLPLRPIPRDHKLHPRFIQPPEKGYELLQVLLLCQTPQRQQHDLFLSNPKTLPDPFSLFPLLLRAAPAPYGCKTLCPDSCGNHLHGPVHPIARQQTGHLLRRHNHPVRPFQNKAGKKCGRLLSPGLPRAEIMGIILINRVVGMHDGNPEPLSDPLRDQKAAELALGMNQIRPPGKDFSQPPAGWERCPGARINPGSIYGWQVIHIPFPIRISLPGKRHHPHLTAQPFQLLLQRDHAGHHSVDYRFIPVGCN